MDGRGIVLRYTSPDGEEAYPGSLQVSVNYVVSDDNSLQITYEGFLRRCSNQGSDIQKRRFIRSLQGQNDYDAVSMAQAYRQLNAYLATAELLSTLFCNR